MTIRNKAYNIKVSYPNHFVDFMEAMFKHYGDKIFSIHGIANKHLDVCDYGKNFFGNSASVASMSVDANGNVNGGKNIIQYNAERFKGYAKLNSIYLIYKWVSDCFDIESAQEAVERLLNGDIFVNDLINFESPYCFAFDLRNLLTEGMNFFKGNFEIKAPTKSQSFINLLIQSIAYISNSITGAASFPDFFPILDWFYRKEMGDNYLEDSENVTHIMDQFQHLIYSLNYPFRGNQSAFTNMSVMDRGFLENLFENYTFPDFTTVDVESSLSLSKLFSEYYDEINGTEGIFTFPVLTHALSLDENNEYIDPETVKWSADTNALKGLSNIFQSEPSAFSSCCRLVNRYEKSEYQNSFGVGGLSIGSHRVAGINLPRMAKTGEFKESLESVKKILVAHRRLMESNIDKGIMPLYDAGWIHLSRQNSTIGIIGAYEYVKNKGKDIKTEEGQAELLEVMDYINDKIEEWTKEFDGSRWNIEQIPGEGMAVRLAAIDKMMGYNDDEYKLYSNQYLPLIEEATFVDRLKIQGVFDSKTSGGAICHINYFDTKPMDGDQLLSIMDTARKLNTVYFARNDIFNRCENGHFSTGRIDACPICSSDKIEKFTRVVGFLTPVDAWTDVRRDWEFDERKSIHY